MLQNEEFPHVDFTGYFEKERQVKHKLEDDFSCGITTGALSLTIKGCVRVCV